MQPFKQFTMLSNSSGANFSNDKKYRYSLWRIWDESKPKVMFIGLNPSTANETKNDNTITKISKIAKYNGFGGFFMVNCFAFISTNPESLRQVMHNNLIMEWTDNDMSVTASYCTEVVFAWGSFDVVKETGRDKELIEMFPNAKCLFVNKNGSPKHPLYCKDETKLISFKK